MGFGSPLTHIFFKPFGNPIDTFSFGFPYHLSSSLIDFDSAVGLICIYKYILYFKNIRFYCGVTLVATSPLSLVSTSKVTDWFSDKVLKPSIWTFV